MSYNLSVAELRIVEMFCTQVRHYHFREESVKLTGVSRGIGIQETVVRLYCSGTAESFG